MKKNSPITTLFIIIIILFSQSVFSATITSVGSGDWSNSATWDAGVPNIGDDVIISNGHTVTLNQDASILSLIVNGNIILGNNATARSLTITGSTLIAGTGSFNVGAFNITHAVSMQGALTNNGVFNLRNTSSRVANVTLDGTFSIGGTNSPQFNNITFNSGTVTAAVALDINGSVIIENGAVFADGDFVHTVAGNWTENGTGQMTGNGTIQMDAPLIQSITAPATFYNLTFNSGQIGVIAGNIEVTNDFLVTNNTEVTTSNNSAN